MDDLLSFQHLRAALAEYGQTLLDQYRANLTASGRPTAHGDTLRSTAEWEVTVDGNNYVLTLSLQDYWKFVENDTRPHFPPPDAIKKWITIKTVLPSPDSRGRVPSPDSLAYLIGRKIAREGTRGTHDLEDARAEREAEAMTAIRAAIQQDLSEEIDRLLAIVAPAAE